MKYKASDIKWVSLYSTIKMMHGTIYIRLLQTIHVVPALSPHYNRHLSHHFYRHSMHAYSDKYHTNDLPALHVASYR